MRQLASNTGRNCANISDAGAQLGVDFLRVTAGQKHPGVTRADGIAWAADGLTAWVEEAKAAGVTLVYENHAIGYGWTYFDFSQTASIFLEICDRTADSGLQLLFDTANLLAVDDDPLAVLETVLPRVAAVHASDIRRTGAFEPVLLGSGVTPLNTIFARLAVQPVSMAGYPSKRPARPAKRDSGVP